MSDIQLVTNTFYMKNQFKNQKKTYTVREEGTFKFKNGGKYLYHKDLTLEDIISAVRNDLKKFGIVMKTEPNGMYGEFIAGSEHGEIVTTPNKIFNDAETRLHGLATNIEMTKWPVGGKALFQKLLKGKDVNVNGYMFRKKKTLIHLSCKVHKWKTLYEVGSDVMESCPYCVKKGTGMPSIYVLEFYSDDDSFIKVGVTRNDVKKRYSFNTAPYKYKILMNEGCSNNLEAEKAIKDKYVRYHPKVDILRNSGSSECFHIDDKIDIMRDILRVIKLNKEFYSPYLNNTIKEIKGQS